MSINIIIKTKIQNVEITTHSIPYSLLIIILRTCYEYTKK